MHPTCPDDCYEIWWDSVGTSLLNARFPIQAWSDVHSRLSGVQPGRIHHDCRKLLLKGSEGGEGIRYLYEYIRPKLEEL